MRTLNSLSERQETLKLRLDLASQLKREFRLGGDGVDGYGCHGGSFANPTAELMVHTHGSVWASMQESGLRKYYTLSEESTLIEAQLGMRKNAFEVFHNMI